MTLSRKLPAALMAAGLSAAFACTSYAGGARIVYQGHEEGFVVTEHGTGSMTDLFPELKDLMPGDIAEEEISVANSSGSDNVRFLLRPDPEKEGDSDLLSKLQMTVKNGEEVLYRSAPEAAGYGDAAQGVLLGTYSSGEAARLTVTVGVPRELENTYADHAEEFCWIVTVEEAGERTPDDSDFGPEDRDDPGHGPGGGPGGGSGKKDSPGGNTQGPGIAKETAPEATPGNASKGSSSGGVSGSGTGASSEVLPFLEGEPIPEKNRRRRPKLPDTGEKRYSLLWERSVPGCVIFSVLSLAAVLAFLKRRKGS